MAKPVTLKFGEFVIQVGDGADPEVFSPPCGFTSKSFDGSASTTEDNVPDCDDPDAPTWTETGVTALSRTISGSGILAKEAVEMLDDWFASGLAKNVKLAANFAGQTNTWAGAFVCTAFSMTASQVGGRVQQSISLKSSGEVVRTDS